MSKWTNHIGKGRS